MSPVRRCFALLLLAGVSGCHTGSTADPLPPPLPTAFATTVIFMGVELPAAGTALGGHFAGAGFETRQATYQMSDGARERWTQQARERGEALLRGSGFRVRGVGPSSSDAQPMFGVQYGLSGRVQSLTIRTTGSSEPFRVDVQSQVAWELLDLGSGTAVFGRLLPGTAREHSGLDAVVGEALDASLARLLADSLFRRALATPRSDPDEDAALMVREIASRRELILLGPGDMAPSGETGAVSRIAAGLITLFGPDHEYGTAFVITRDGLAIAPARALGHSDRLRARLPNGVDRPVRVLRSHAGLNVALLRIPCPGPCTTVDWEAPRGVDVYTNVLAIAAPVRDADSVVVAMGRVGGRWGIANGISLQGMEGQVAGGEPVARASSGRVFGVIAMRRGQKVVLMLDEVLRALGMRLEPPVPRRE